MALEIIDYILGGLSLTFVVISVVIGFTILSKYPKFKSRLYLLIGITWLGLATPWIPDSMSLLTNIFFQTSLPINMYLIIGNTFLPIALLCWIIAITDMVDKKEQMLFVSLTIIFGVAFELIFFILFYINYPNLTLLGTWDPSRPFSIDYGLFLTIGLMIVILIILITGLQFTQKSVRSDNEEIKLKGKLLRAAFIMFTIAAILEKPMRSIMLGLVFDDPSTPLLSVMLVIVRILLITSAFAFYGGFLLPRWMHSLLTHSKSKSE
ncbi:MAG: hypothetical protein ACXAC7_23135 [Candidatus Hodarchaeales archaeon]|jgi:hypothetical protein